MSKSNIEQQPVMSVESERDSKEFKFVLGSPAAQKPEYHPKHYQTTHNTVLATLANFNSLPDCSYVRQPVVLALFACSPPTLWRWVKHSRIPSPKKLGSRISAWNVGQLRECLDSLQSSNQEKFMDGDK